MREREKNRKSNLEKNMEYICFFSCFPFSGKNSSGGGGGAGPATRESGLAYLGGE